MIVQSPSAMLSTNISTGNLCRKNFVQLSGSNYEHKSSINSSMMRTDPGNSSTTKCWQNIPNHRNNEQTSWQYKYSREHIFVPFFYFFLFFFFNMWQVLYILLGMIFFWLSWLWWKWLMLLLLFLLLLLLLWFFFWLFVYLFVVAFIFIQ